MNRVIDETFGWNWEFNDQKQELPSPAAVPSLAQGFSNPVLHLLVGESEEVWDQGNIKVSFQFALPALSNLQFMEFLNKSVCLCS